MSRVIELDQRHPCKPNSMMLKESFYMRIAAGIQVK